MGPTVPEFQSCTHEALHQNWVPRVGRLRLGLVLNRGGGSFDNTCIGKKRRLHVRNGLTWNMYWKEFSPM